MTNMIMGPPIFAPLLFGTSAYLGLIASYLQREDGKQLTSGKSGQAVIAGSLRSCLHAPGATSSQPSRIFAKVNSSARLRIVAGISALLSGFEAYYSHYKNNFRYKVQWSPVILAPLLAAAAFLSVKKRRVATTALPALSTVACADAAVGFYYHARGVLRRPGGRKHLLYNIMYGPPIFAPLLFGAAGMLGILASLLRRGKG